ncbi:hypothetical protein BD560DRAFT_492290 [Blakeslea trispora]|nr:hypothetical protein BD560DRAFT_492290 [Blakeslea trispora]
MFELLETYSEDNEAVVLSNFLIEKKDQCFKNNKNSVDWVDLSNAVERFGSFKAISQAEHSKFDLFAGNSKYMSPLMLVDKIKVWRHTANYIDKLHLQDLLYYNILDFTSTNKDDGIHEVLGSFYQAEKEKHQHLYKPSRRVARLARDLLLQDNAQDKDDKSLKSRYKAAKHRLEELKKKKVTVEEYDDAKTITKFVKIFLLTQILSSHDSGKLEAKNLKQMYQSLISLKAEVSLTSRKYLKLYGFHCYFFIAFTAKYPKVDVNCFRAEI